MADSTVRFTLSWGEMKLELEGDAAPTLAELQNIRTNGLGRLAEFFSLRTQVGSINRDPGSPLLPPPRPDAPPAAPSGGRTTSQYSVGRLKIPTTAAEATTMAQRYGAASPTRGNLLGNLFAGLGQSLSLDLGNQLASAAPTAWLLYFVPGGAASASGATLTVRMGRERLGSPGSYVIDESAPAQVFQGTTLDDTFVTSGPTGPTGPLTVAMDPPLTMGLNIFDPYLELNLASPSIMGGKLQGVVNAQAFNESFVQGLGMYVVGELTRNPTSETSRTLRATFLSAAQADQVPTGAEMATIMREHSLINSLLTPDATAPDGNPALSIALSFAARPFQ